MATNKRAGNHSAQQNDSLAPYAPTVGTATDVGVGRAYNNGAATVTFTPDARNAATSYTVTSSPGGYTSTGSSSPITVAGLQSATAYTFTVTATNSYGTSSASSASNQITATTVPATPSAPSASSPSAGTDTVSWTAPATGGQAITNYHWTSDDGKSGDTTSTSVSVAQEQGTAQTYNVYATNVNGNSGTSAQSNSVTTTFSFAPFGAFGFSPFGFSPFGFSPFGFSPFGFSPFGFSPFRCIAGTTKIATLKNGKLDLVMVKDLQVGKIVLSPTWLEYSNDDDPYNSKVEYSGLTEKELMNGTVAKITTKTVDKTIIINGDSEKHYSLTQPVLSRKGSGLNAWEFTKDLEVGDIVWEYSFDNNDFEEVEITSLDIIDGEETVYALSIDGVHTFIAGGIVSHNKL
jgi:hypothetical protein